MTDIPIAERPKTLADIDGRSRHYQVRALRELLEQRTRERDEALKSHERLAADFQSASDAADTYCGELTKLKAEHERAMKVVEAARRLLGYPVQRGSEWALAPIREAVIAYDAALSPTDNRI